MSHFTVLVIGENPEQQLEPYSENMEMEPYKEYLSDDEIKKMKEYYTKMPPVEKSNTDILPHMSDWRGQKGFIDEKGIGYFSTYNSDSKWDWYQLGGRWTGFFKLKPVLSIATDNKAFIVHNGFTNGELENLKTMYQENKNKFDCVINKYGNKKEEIINFIEADLENDSVEVFPEHKIGMPGIQTDSQKRGYADQAYKRDIDFKGMKTEAIEKAKKSWMQAKTKNIAERFFIYGIDENTTKDQYIEQAKTNTSFAVVKDGKWYERGTMGWWGVVSDRKNPDAWDDEYNKLLDNVPDDTLLSLYDCHI